MSLPRHKLSKKIRKERDVLYQLADAAKNMRPEKFAIFKEKLTAPPQFVPPAPGHGRYVPLNDIESGDEYVIINPRIPRVHAAEIPNEAKVREHMREKEVRPTIHVPDSKRKLNIVRRKIYMKEKTRLVAGRRRVRVLAHEKADLHLSASEHRAILEPQVEEINRKFGTRAKTLAGAIGTGRRLRILAHSIDLLKTTDARNVPLRPHLVASAFKIAAAAFDHAMSTGLPHDTTLSQIGKLSARHAKHWTDIVLYRFALPSVKRKLEALLNDRDFRHEYQDRITMWFDALGRKRPEIAKAFPTSSPRKLFKTIPLRHNSLVEESNKELLENPRSQRVRRAFERDRTLANALRILLLLAGVEPNPGPPKPSLKSSTSAKVLAKLQELDAQAKSRQGEIDRLTAQLDEKQRECSAVKTRLAVSDKENRVLSSRLIDARRNGFTLKHAKTIYEGSFHGFFSNDSNCTFEPHDPIVHLSVCEEDGKYYVYHDVNHAHPVVLITREMIAAAVVTTNCSDRSIRMRNIYTCITNSADVRASVKDATAKELIEFGVTAKIVAFLLTGMIASSGRIVWLNVGDEYIPPMYTVKPPEEWPEMLRNVRFSDATAAFQAKWSRKFRAAPIRVDGIVPHIPDASDTETMKAGLCKRLFPDLPMRSQQVLADLERITDAFIRYITSHSEWADVEDREELILNALKDRPVKERVAMLEGVDLAHVDPFLAISEYVKQPYKTFVKAESYPEPTKPPRFIMMLPLRERGVQLYFMCRILRRIEIATREFNVKGLTADEITSKLHDKFSETGNVAETDFGSFESSIGIDLKRRVENRVYRALCETDSERKFVDDCLDREFVELRGPTFNVKRFHHIRMSGDYWTSLGNLITNFVIQVYCNRCSVDLFAKVCLLEGDDGVYPAPSNPEEVCARASTCGVKLTFDIAPYKSLSFCGNHFVDVDGNLVRHRHPYKALANCCTIFSIPQSTYKNDIMLQRAKVLSYLSGPNIPDAFVFFACVERRTRFMRVDTEMLRRHGLLKPYTSFGVESCVPDYLADPALDDDSFIDVVYRVNWLAGGECPKSRIREIWTQLRDSNFDCPMAVTSPLQATGTVNWIARDGSRFTHTYRPFGKYGPTTVRYCDVRVRDAPSVLNIGASAPHTMTHTYPEFHRKNRVIDVERFNNVFDVLVMFAVLMIPAFISMVSFVWRSRSKFELCTSIVCLKRSHTLYQRAVLALVELYFQFISPSPADIAWRYSMRHKYTTYETLDELDILLLWMSLFLTIAAVVTSIIILVSLKITCSCCYRVRPRCSNFVSGYPNRIHPRRQATPQPDPESSESESDEPESDDDDDDPDVMPRLERVERPPTPALPNSISQSSSSGVIISPTTEDGEPVVITPIPHLARSFCLHNLLVRDSIQSAWRLPQVHEIDPAMKRLVTQVVAGLTPPHRSCSQGSEEPELRTRVLTHEASAPDRLEDPNPASGGESPRVATLKIVRSSKSATPDAASQSHDGKRKPSTRSKKKKKGKPVRASKGG